MAANKKEKIFALMYNTSDVAKLRKFVEDIKNQGGSTQKSKYLTWANYCGFYTLASLEDTYWTVDKLTAAIYKYMEKNINLIIFEIQDAPVQGRMVDKYWTWWKESQDLTGTFKNYKRARKLEKIISYTKRKAELDKKEQDIARRKAELKKAISLKKKEDELKAQERELDELEKQLHPEPEVIEETPKKKRKGFWR